ncbi:SymE family type I addiction module toxin [Chitinophaga eiseniae]
MSGLWMEKVGFKVGDAIEVTVEVGKLIVKKASSKSSNQV